MYSHSKSLLLHFPKSPAHVFLVIIYSIFCFYHFNFLFFFQLNLWPTKIGKGALPYATELCLGYSAKTLVFIVKSDAFRITSSCFFLSLYEIYRFFCVAKTSVNCHYFNILKYLYVHNWTSWKVESYICKVIDNSWIKWGSIAKHKMMW